MVPSSARLASAIFATITNYLQKAIDFNPGSKPPLALWFCLLRIQSAEEAFKNTVLQLLESDDPFDKIEWFTAEGLLKSNLGAQYTVYNDCIEQILARLTMLAVLIHPDYYSSKVDNIEAPHTTALFTTLDLTKDELDRVMLTFLDVDSSIDRQIEFLHAANQKLKSIKIEPRLFLGKAFNRFERIRTKLSAAASILGPNSGFTCSCHQRHAAFLKVPEWPNSRGQVIDERFSLLFHNNADDLTLYDEDNDTDVSKNNRTDKWFESYLQVRKVVKRIRKNRPNKPEHRVRVAVLDTGVNVQDPFLNPFAIKRRIIYRDFAQPGSSSGLPVDEVGHGTHICGTLLTIADNIDLYVARVSKDGKRWNGYQVAEAIKGPRKSGTSYATPVAAGVAAMVLDYMWAFKDDEKYKPHVAKLLTRRGMLSVFKQMVEEYPTHDYLVPWKLFNSRVSGDMDEDEEEERICIEEESEILETPEGKGPGMGIVEAPEEQDPGMGIVEKIVGILRLL
ncbi:hypothetical protein B0I35DRAFT_483166 [Stachybotrys elegans]|uniref:Peptidase S8/S53 domain-containing protein n=1 Tax=Stachybotrys elegans TaxID=80388 RepID=A0A8K0SL31_9HYPO|nr:hypothetical protein B0I35DRAFT_483166 [Stachybotrys elegans]